MYFDNNKNLVLESKRMAQGSRPIIFLLEKCLSRPERESVLRGPNGEYWRVENHRSEEGDCLNLSQFKATCFIIKKRPDSKVAECACLYILQINEGGLPSTNESNGKDTRNTRTHSSNPGQTVALSTGKTKNFIDTAYKRTWHFWRHSKPASKDGSHSPGSRVLSETQEANNSFTSLVGVYDSPMMVRSIDSDSAKRLSVTDSGKVVLNDWKITILSGKFYSPLVPAAFYH